MYSWPTAAFKLSRKGVRVSYFLPLLRNLYYTLHMNLRNHRKVLVIDGKLGFTGGLNIHAHNMGHKGREAMIHDIHFKVQGPIVGILQDVFLKGWYFSTKEPIQKVVYYDNQHKGNIYCAEAFPQAHISNIRCYRACYVRRFLLRNIMCAL